MAEPSNYGRGGGDEEEEEDEEIDETVRQVSRA